MDPCSDFYRFACGRFDTHHPIPPDQPAISAGYLIYNAITLQLWEIMVKSADSRTGRNSIEQRVGDFYAACMNRQAIQSKGLAPVKPLLDEVNHAERAKLGSLVGKLQRIGVNAFFRYGQSQSLKDPSRVIAVIDQGGLGLPERDYYLREGMKDRQLRGQYVAHVAKMLSLSGQDQSQAMRAAKAVLAFEVMLARASQTVTEKRMPENVYHIRTTDELRKSSPELHLDDFLATINSPRITDLNVASPHYMDSLSQAIRDTQIDTLRAYMRYQLLTAFASELPIAFDEEDFDFNQRKLNGLQHQLPRWNRCSVAVDADLGDALGQLYVRQHFGENAKLGVLEMVTDIEQAMERDLNQLDWMSPATKAQAQRKLRAIAKKIGYPDRWRDYSTLRVDASDAFGNQARAAAFESDYQLAKIGKTADPTEWTMTPPTINAYYDLNQNSVNFPAGILQTPFYNPKSDLALNYGHVGSIIGHELTHGFDDQGAQFDSKGALINWWRPEDKKEFETRSACLVDEYSKFVTDDNLHVNGRLTLGENTADNGGLLLSFLAYMERAKEDRVDVQKRIDGYTGAQRFYIAYAQNWCENMRPEQARNQVLTDPHTPNHLRVNGVIVNQPEFRRAFNCRTGAPMAPASTCRVW